MSEGGSEWQIDSHPGFDAWLVRLSPRQQERVVALIRLLQQHGPHLGRPYSDRIKGSRHHNLKELRADSGKREALRILYYFDARRTAVLLVGGDKAGEWETWYVDNIRLAEQRIEWLVAHGGEPESGGIG